MVGTSTIAEASTVIALADWSIWITALSAVTVTASPSTASVDSSKFTVLVRSDDTKIFVIVKS